MPCQWVAKVGTKLNAEHKEHIRLGQLGAKNGKWKGGRKLNHGYVVVKNYEHGRADGSGYVFEHVLVAEKKLARAMLAGEVVHHADLDRTNNDPCNLIVMGKGEHARYHRNLNRLFEHWVGV